MTNAVLPGSEEVFSSENALGRDIDFNSPAKHKENKHVTRLDKTMSRGVYPLSIVLVTRDGAIWYVYFICENCLLFN